MMRVGETLKDKIAPGDRILKVDGQDIEDVLDFHYYSVLTQEPILQLRDSSGEVKELALASEDLDGSNLEFEPLVFKSCGNDCVFCFIHQMPPGLREDLYFMDEDYRLGFMYGNYVTLALARERELDRIIRQQLSPVYLSVHATDMPLRNKLLGLKRSRNLDETIRRLIDGGITLHTQVVLLPAWNDGEHLDKTLRDLAAYFPDVASLGIVPVGLTDHRKTLTDLVGFDVAGAARALEQVEAFQSEFHAEHGCRFVYMADEFYLLAGRAFPSQDEYEDFPLIDNGIGMGREFVETVKAEAARWEKPQADLRVGILTGRLGEILFEEYLRDTLAALPGIEFEIKILDNKLFGSRITVSGLLPGRELLDAALELPEDLDLLLLPPNTLNASELFLDDLSLEDFRAAVPMPVAIAEAGLLDIIGQSIPLGD
ncbi:DUF512 domain-containing protein [bacterium]|nr:DUF512 domain-containing protein [bacterium]